VLVRPKAGILDPQGQAVESSLRQLGFDVAEARVGRLIDLDVLTDDRSRALAELERMCERLLANPLIESYAIELDEPAGAERGAGDGAGVETTRRAAEQHPG
jgi:phosphoribosylformylglycinamidine synthase subunit PurS